MKRRLLLLSSSTGSGHDMRANAFAEWVREIHGEAVDIRVEQVIESTSLLGRFGVWVYNTIQQHAPLLHNLYFFIVEAVMAAAHRGKVGMGGEGYRSLLRHYKPDLVLSFHDSTNRGYFEDARRVLGEKVRCGTYCGEFSGGFGYSRHWVNPSADFFVARTAEAREFAVRRGMPREKTSVFARLLPPEAFRERMDAGEIRAFRRRLGLEPSRFTLFLSTGGYGANHHAAFVRALFPLTDKVQLIVVCGRSPRALANMRRLCRYFPTLRLHLEGYSRQVHRYLEVSDAVVTRAGANTTMEAIHFSCPILYDSLGGLMPQERCTTRYVLRHGAGRLLGTASGLRRVLEDWSEKGPDYTKVREGMHRLRKTEDPRDLVKQVTGG